MIKTLVVTLLAGVMSLMGTGNSSAIIINNPDGSITQEETATSPLFTRTSVNIRDSYDMVIQNSNSRWHCNRLKK